MINAFLLYIADKLVEDVDIDSLWTTFMGPVLLTILHGVWSWLVF